MATAKELYDAGRLGEAIDALIQSVKARPTDIQQRTFLFELLCFSGDYDRAEKQLDVLAGQSAHAELGAQIYRNALSAERARQRLFTEGQLPHFLAEPPAYVGLHLAAINYLREGHYAEARALLDQAEEERPALAGKLNGEPFSDFRDYDDLTAPVLEMFIQERYVWMPFEQIKSITIEPPKRLRDLLWATARIEHIDEKIEKIGDVFLPVLYAGSSGHSNEQVKLGRMTEWTTITDELVVAAGMRLFLVDGKDLSIMESHNLEFNLPADAMS